MQDDRLSILKGALDILILKALSWGPTHGYGVSYWIRQVTEEAFTIVFGVTFSCSASVRMGGSSSPGWSSPDATKYLTWLTIWR